ncbi:Phospholipase D [Cardinium endosymbiont of Sogatella furcifera]|uniref:phospholipase D-like domain-containing protein n=1 Tax=Cardinium endosymbiont of Sogatella furcifera TaxID=650378 RepID=UPI000E0D723B|nr:phospholipase D-like domain-containing protein [Cardinium endosymbiont of Sogatella furcifera]AXI23912.1 Phospholipase D [Cardinium endosymbiont of Sogatella furcifera]
MKKSTIGKLPHITHMWVKLLATISIVLSSLLVNYTACHTSNRLDSDLAIQAWFTPQDPCMDLIVAKVLSAKTSILVQAYVITSRQIADALIAAHQNKVAVQLLIDKDAPTTKGSKVNELLRYGMPIIIDKTVGYAHNKVMIIDDEYVITGSFNWTHGAQTRNAENLVMITGKEINRRFKNNWYMRAAVGERLKYMRNH